MKIFILNSLRILGFFKLSKSMMRRKLLILAYHGVEMNDESSFQSKLFIKPVTLVKRMEYLRKKKFNVLGLGEALQRLNNGSLPNNSVVITVDDGWYSTMYYANQVFSKYEYPYTIYVTSYYSEKKVPVLNVALSYILWACKKHTIKLDYLAIPDLSGTYSVLDIKEKSEMEVKLFEYFRSIQSHDKKLIFIQNISTLLEVNYQKIETKRYLSLLSFEEIHALSNNGVDIQLHTHRHTIPFDDMRNFRNEITENKDSLNAYVKNNLEHFCYPSGQHVSNCENILKNMGIRSATTCDPGFVGRQTNRYYMPRFLDGENISQLVFEAEVSGVLNFFRNFRVSITRFF